MQLPISRFITIWWLLFALSQCTTSTVVPGTPCTVQLHSYNFYPGKLNRDECHHTVQRDVGSQNTSGETKGTPVRNSLAWKSPREGWNLLLPRNSPLSLPLSPLLFLTNSEFHHIDSGFPSLSQTSISIYKEGPIYKLPADSPACGVWLDVPTIEYILMVIGPEDFQLETRLFSIYLHCDSSQKTQHFLSFFYFLPLRPPPAF